MRARLRRAGHRIRWKTVIAGSVAALTLITLIAAPLIVIAAFRGWRAHENAHANNSATHLNELVRDGTVGFTVRAAHCGLTTVGGTSQPTKGQFCTVAVQVTNNGSKPVTLVDVAQRATGSRGAFYLPDLPADAIVNAGDLTVAAGGSRDATFVYDIPSGVALTGIEMHAGEYSKGAIVRLSARH